MKIRLLKALLITHNVEPDPVGSVVEVDDQRGNELVGKGYAEPAGEKAAVGAPANKANKAAPDKARGPVVTAPVREKAVTQAATTAPAKKAGGKGKRGSGKAGK